MQHEELPVQNGRFGFEDRFTADQKDVSLEPESLQGSQAHKENGACRISNQNAEV